MRELELNVTGKGIRANDIATVSLSERDINRISDNLNIPLKFHKGCLTRACGANITGVSLLIKYGYFTTRMIDEASWASSHPLGFPISQRKGNILKTGGLKADKRVKRYIMGDDKKAPYLDVPEKLFMRKGSTYYPSKEFAKAIEAAKASIARKERQARALKERHTKMLRARALNMKRAGNRKALITKREAGLISPALALHLG